ncbi:Malate/lactate/ureidoglycolate dehydrogenase, LDH2 family [Tistlia consotensis]|uniref:Malate/lactate/ureidoglycolate dehydrogenase, LDH2 family n=1 Tax=Tistlia consotensis USBA 355 TaxID=560819 RepID=A0A1Y6CMB7_9PROT|nr:Ldh family oxidoreductase [Tistlia consotensis]SMF73706.1 Malate/lactate/ureidoglycolate dehydrogenase, LDH2 family [Tistlia consotensis USBA 355]SNS28523.1 Malate/lactate/ureidoglycolate dehydrogenase, LDH2 family [Tistlia consotensis]
MTARVVAAELLERQARLVLAAWGLPAEQAEATARLLVEADLAGIESHGVGLLTLYRDLLSSGRAVAGATIATAVERGAMAVLDGGGGLGHLVSLRAAGLAADKASAFGVGAVAVRNSNHFGAAGLYARRIAERGLVGFCTTAVWRPAIVPTGGRQPMLGTNPIAFAAPAGRNPAFLLDMATSTAAIGKARTRLFAGLPLPDGWGFDEEGGWERDPERLLATPRLSPLGGDEEHGGHKGYGLAALVEILSTVLAGAAFAPLRPADRKPCDVGHFFLALDPAFFRPAGGFEGDLDDFVDALRASLPLEADRPVQVAGDPEYRCEAVRRAEGIPLPAALVERLRVIASEAGAAFLLDGDGRRDGRCEERSGSG